MNQILKRAYEIKLAIEYLMREEDTAYEYHLEVVTMIIYLGFPYLKKNPLDLKVNFKLDVISELALLLEDINNFEGMTREEKEFIKLASELLKF